MTILAVYRVQSVNRVKRVKCSMTVKATRHTNEANIVKMIYVDDIENLRKGRKYIPRVFALLVATSSICSFFF